MSSSILSVLFFFYIFESFIFFYCFCFNSGFVSLSISSLEFSFLMSLVVLFSFIGYDVLSMLNNLFFDMVLQPLMSLFFAISLNSFNDRSSILILLNNFLKKKICLLLVLSIAKFDSVVRDECSLKYIHWQSVCMYSQYFTRLFICS